MRKEVLQKLCKLHGRGEGLKTAVAPLPYLAEDHTPTAEYLFRFWDRVEI